MSLRNDSEWDRVAKTQNMPSMAAKVYRTAFVYGSGLNVWAVVTNTTCTAAQFRAAVKEKVGNGTLVDGVSSTGVVRHRCVAMT